MKKHQFDERFVADELHVMRAHLLEANDEDEWVTNDKHKNLLENNKQTANRNYNKSKLFYLNPQKIFIEL